MRVEVKGIFPLEQLREYVHNSVRNSLDMEPDEYTYRVVEISHNSVWVEVFPAN